jgi:hypothetical protein
LQTADNIEQAMGKGGGDEDDDGKGTRLAVSTAALVQGSGQLHQQELPDMT